MNKIINGQLWIDKNSPYRLKYTVNGKIYTVDVSTDYFIDDNTISEENKLYAGTVVAFKNGGIKRAVFPDDIDNVIGVIGNTISSKDDPVSILKTGTISLTKEDIDNILFGVNSFDDLLNFANVGQMIGAPVYWFIGEEIKSDGKYSYHYGDTDEGKISLLTPTGRKWKFDPNGDIDPSFNVSYDNLPIIGFIDKIILEGNEISKIDIYLNVNKFDTTLEWSWPFVESTSSPFDSEGMLVIRHGLFPISFKDFNNFNFRQRNACTIVALNKSDDNEYEVSANVQNYYGQNDEQDPDDDPRTVIYDLSDLYRYRITGTVNLKFDRKELIEVTEEEANG